MPNKCCYCGREEDPVVNIFVEECPVCMGLVCGICMTTVLFHEYTNDEGEDIIVQSWQGFVCKSHLSWTIIEAIKKRVEEERNG